jgi:hypothetical protein
MFIYLSEHLQSAVGIHMPMHKKVVSLCAHNDSPTTCDVGDAVL